MKLHIGEGKILQTIVGEQKQAGQEKSYDLNKLPWPFEDSSVDEVKMENVLESVDDIVEVMEEIHRICKNEAKVYIIVPYFNSSSNCNPTSRHNFGFSTFYYFIQGQNPLYSGPYFKIIKIKGIPSKWFRWIPNFSIRWLIRHKNPFMKFRDILSLLFGEITQYLYIELEISKAKREE